MGFLAEILFQIGRVLFFALLNIFAGEALGWLFSRIGQGVSAGTQAIGTMIGAVQGQDDRAVRPLAAGGVICAACGMRVPRRKFCANCGRLLRRAKANPAPK